MVKLLAWSHTALEDFKSCPRAFYEKKIAKSVKEEETEAMIWGKRVHEYFELRQRDGQPLPADLQEHEPYMQRLEALPGVLSTERKVALNIYKSPCAWFAKDTWVRGVIDYSKIHENHALLVDYKTGKAHSKFKQLKLFALYTFIENPNVETVQVRYYWTQTQTASEETYARDQMDELWDVFVPDLRQYVSAFKTDTWQPRPSGLCHGWCPVKHCEHWKPRKS